MRPPPIIADAIAIAAFIAVLVALVYVMGVA